MQRLIKYLFAFLLCVPGLVLSQTNDSVDIYMLTCLPGKDVANVYGHSAIRVVNPANGIDQVYNWGVYDFKTPNFVWKFAKGRLNYKIATCSYDWFLQSYIAEQRSVISQKTNLSPEDKDKLIALINNNMLPENVFYLYDFYYDNCATRIRDIFEKTLGNKLIYPAEKNTDLPTFRENTNKVQQPIPWLSVGTDLLIGISGDKKAGFRERMFLPDDLMLNFSLSHLHNNGKLTPLLQEPVTVLKFNPSSSEQKSPFTPLVVLSILLMCITVFSFVIKSKYFHNFMDIILFSVFSKLAILMIFFVFFTDHQVMKMNLNIIWLNPFLIFAFLSLFTKCSQKLWFRIVLVTSAGFLLCVFILPQSINTAFIPVILILIIRSAFRSGLNKFPLQKQ